MAKPTCADCKGCHNNFYNGNNSLGVTECWSLKTATFVKAHDIPVDRRPPYLKLPLVKRPSCYKAKGYCRVKPESLNTQGYWKQ